MRRLEIDETWPESWRHSHSYDLEEVFGQVTDRGYAYAYENRQRKTLRLLAEGVLPGAKVLDIGAAQGNFSLALAEAGYNVTWNDLRDELAGYVRLKHERGHLEFAPGNAFDLAFEEPFDAVLITEIIEHVAHPDQFLANASALVRPGGCVVLTTPNGGYFRNTLPKFSACSDPSIYEFLQFKPNADGHIFLLHTDELRPLAVAAGLVLETYELFTNPLTNGHCGLGPVLKMMPRSWVSSVEGLTAVLPSAVSRRLSVHMGARFRRPRDT